MSRAFEENVRRIVTDLSDDHLQSLVHEGIYQLIERQLPMPAVLGNTALTSLANGRLIVCHRKKYIIKDQQVVHIPKLRFSALSLLAKYADEPVSAPKIVKNIWPEYFSQRHDKSSEALLHKADVLVNRLRTSLGRDDLGHPGLGVITHVPDQGWVAKTKLVYRGEGNIT